MSALGCSFPTDLGGERAICGTYLGLGELVPILCAPCQTALRARQVAPRATCEGCGIVPATRTRPPWLCDECEADYAADLEALGDPGDAGSRCTSGCGHCGRCGGA